VSATYRIGHLDVAVLSDGLYHQDAGAVFGLVPKIMWQDYAGPLDDRHRLSLAMNSLLLRSQGRLILIETGIGDKDGARRQASPAEQGNLLTDLAHLGVTPGEIDVVINTHLHADHCGWNTSRINDALAPTFPNAEYIVMRDEWEAAIAPNERTRATYLQENLLPIAEAERLRLLDGESRITDEVTVVPAPGHSAGHAAVVLASGRESALYIGDLVQMAVQLERTAWVSAFDILPLISMETKKALVDGAIEGGSLIIGSHLPFPGAGRLTLRDNGWRKWTPVEPRESP
jgi:glyoxylase-like metal-dependent hydrolase (beta-lactamase superfamily II)